MAKKSQTPSKTESAAAPEGEKTVKKTAAKKASKTSSGAENVSKPATRKAAPRKPAVAKAEPAAAPSDFSSEAIALRAYYLGEKRQQLGLPGDSAHDWIEAERQLREEAQAKS